MSMDVKKTKKYCDLVETARDLFRRYGLKRVSIGEVCKTAKVSKMTFYRFFKNKDALAINILDEEMTAVIDQIDEIMEGTVPFAEKLEGVMVAREKFMDLLGPDFLMDLLDDSTEPGAYLMARRGEAMKRVRGHFENAQRNGEIRDDIRVDFIMIMADYFRVFLRDEKLNALYQKPSELMKEVTNFYHYGILGRKEEK